MYLTLNKNVQILKNKVSAARFFNTDSLQSTLGAQQSQINIFEYVYRSKRVDIYGHSFISTVHLKLEPYHFTKVRVLHCIIQLLAIKI